MKSAKLLVLAIFAVAACGGGSAISNKQDAAKVAQRLETLGAGSAVGSPTASSATLQGQSGTASATIDETTNITGSGAQIDYTVNVAFKDFSPDGQNTYDGTESVSYDLSASTTGQAATGTVVVTVVADVTTSGEYASHITCNLTMSVDATAIAATSGSVHMVLNGTITADGQTYSYDNETLDVTASAQ